MTASPPALPGSPSEGDLRRFWGGYADACGEMTAVLAAEGVPLLVGHDGVDPGGAVEEMEWLARLGVPAGRVL